MSAVADYSASTCLTNLDLVTVFTGLPSFYTDDPVIELFRFCTGFPFGLYISCILYCLPLFLRTSKVVIEGPVSKVL
jgi:hypothetical protein